MIDEKKWNLARVRLEAMRKSIPRSIDTDMVAEYHGIISALGQASGEDLSDFRIHDLKVTRRVTSIQIGSRHGPGRVDHSPKGYCPRDYFKRQLEGLAAYLPHIHSPNTPAAPRDYDSMSDEVLENLASKYNIGGYGVARGIDRRVIITALQERDRSLHHPAVQPAIHIANVTGSIIQQSPSHSPATLNYQAADVASIFTLVKRELSTLPLSSEDRSELGVHVQTAESQLSTRRPNQVVVHECLQSARAILEGITGSIIATEIVQKITRLIGH